MLDRAYESCFVQENQDEARSTRPQPPRRSRADHAGDGAFLRRLLGRPGGADPHGLRHAGVSGGYRNRVTGAYHDADSARRYGEAETGSNRRCRVHRTTEVRVDLEMQVRNAACVPGVADVADDLALLDPPGEALVRRQVAVVVAVAVVADQRERDTAEHLKGVLGDEARHHGLQLRSGRGEHVDTLVSAAPAARSTPRVAVRRRSRGRDR